MNELGVVATVAGEFGFLSYGCDGSVKKRTEEREKKKQKKKIERMKENNVLLRYIKNLFIGSFNNLFVYLNKFFYYLL